MATQSGQIGTLLRSIPTPVTAGTAGAFALARAGDRDGDGKEDFWASSTVTGAAYLLNETGTVLVQVSDPGTPRATEGGYGARLAAVSDLNGDGKPEALIAKPGIFRGLTPLSFPRRLPEQTI
jgi:hypothetical protein